MKIPIQSEKSERSPSKSMIRLAVAPLALTGFLQKNGQTDPSLGQNGHCVRRSRRLPEMTTCEGRMIYRRLAMRLPNFQVVCQVLIWFRQKGSLTRRGIVEFSFFTINCEGSRQSAFFRD